MKTIVVTGAESTGKSWLSQRLASHFNSKWRPEYLREFFAKHNGVSEAQMELVARTQLELERSLLKENQDELLFLDTNIINLKVYYEYYFKKSPAWFNELYNPSLYDSYLFLDTSVPWEPDEQRESPEVREIISQMLLEEYQTLQIEPLIITGEYEQRMETAINFCRKLT